MQGRERQFKIVWKPCAALWLNSPLQKRPITPSMCMPLYGLLSASDTIALGPLYRRGVWVTLFPSHGRGKQVRAGQDLPTWLRRRNWAQNISWLSATRHSPVCNVCQVTVWMTVGLDCYSIWVFLPQEGHGSALAERAWHTAGGSLWKLIRCILGFVWMFLHINLIRWPSG